MEDDIKELEVLKETIEHMKKARDCMKECDTVTVTEYNIFELYLDDLEDRAEKLEVELHGCILQEV